MNLASIISKTPFQRSFLVTLSFAQSIDISLDISWRSHKISKVVGHAPGCTVVDSNSEGVSVEPCCQCIRTCLGESAAVCCCHHNNQPCLPGWVLVANSGRAESVMFSFVGDVVSSLSMSICGEVSIWEILQVQECRWRFDPRFGPGRKSQLIHLEIVAYSNHQQHNRHHCKNKQFHCRPTDDRDECCRLPIDKRLNDERPAEKEVDPTPANHSFI